MNATLPPPFGDLEYLTESWALPTSALRDARRSESTAGERSAFHDAMAPRLEEALAWLDQQPLATLDQPATNLMNLCLMLAHVALAVETQADDEPRHAPHRAAMQITRTPADA
ncbi:hypothetical protein [Sphingomonas sp. 35-24ZXX]|uniref:hypothetical protein n=1 Tax=Sphingomonas sp. 35-24ZXX TaxID=1545915 RepID=UPI00068D0DE1|nr:hypothetical protein [Sphingomonas sp. 35-24ZXX]